MGNSYTVALSLDKPSPAAYYAGDTLTAQLVFDLNGENFKFKEIAVHLLGKSKCSWGSGKSAREGRETFCDINVGLSEPLENLDDPDRHGYHVCQLTCSLPRNLPSSYETEIGEIYYQVKVIVKGAHVPWTPSRTIKFPIDRVIGLYQVSAGRSWRQPPMEVSESSKIWTPSLRNCGTGTGKLEWSIRLEGGSQYLLGDPIHFSVYLYNQSWAMLDKVCVKIVQIVTYDATGNCNDGSTVEENVMTSKTFGQGLQGPCTTSVVGTIGLRSDWPVTSVDGRCEIMQIAYGVKAHVGLYSVTKTLPISIGNLCR